ncbi:MAG: putative toxin-antitoxin system toxin component, PIN family [Thermoleophilia bacterium]
MLQAVLDVNVFISAFLSPQGTPAAVVEAWRNGRFDLIVSPTLVRELEDVSVRPHLADRIDRSDLILAVADIRRNATLVEDPPPARHVQSDPDDDYLVVLALASGAHAIVTGDTALLALELDRPRILTPRDFLTAIDA